MPLPHPQPQQSRAPHSVSPRASWTPPRASPLIQMDKINYLTKKFQPARPYLLRLMLGSRHQVNPLIYNQDSLKGCLASYENISKAFISVNIQRWVITMTKLTIHSPVWPPTKSQTEPVPSSAFVAMLMIKNAPPCRSEETAAQVSPALFQTSTLPTVLPSTVKSAKRETWCRFLPIVDKLLAV